MHASRLSSGLAVAVLLSLALRPAPADANAGPPFIAGSATGEPTGTVDLAIERETLEIDLRPLADGGPARIDATYRIVADAAARDVELVFVAGSGVADFSATLDDQPLSIARTIDGVDPAWRAPESTPPIEGSKPLPYEVRAPAGEPSFVLHVEPGTHELHVRYDAEAAGAFTEPTISWQIAYVLLPARAWRSFGGLDITVHLPPGWGLASDPPLSRDGDIARGSFDAIPADTLAITTQAPTRSIYTLGRIGAWALVFLMLGIGLPTCARFARRPVDRKLPAIAVLGIAALWTAAFVASVILLVSVDSLTLGKQATPDRDYGDVLAVLGSIALGLPAALAVSFIASRRGR